MFIRYLLSVCIILTIVFLFSSLANVLLARRNGVKLFFLPPGQRCNDTGSFSSGGVFGVYMLLPFMEGLGFLSSGALCAWVQKVISAQ